MSDQVYQGSERENRALPASQQDSQPGSKTTPYTVRENDPEK